MRSRTAWIGLLAGLLGFGPACMADPPAPAATPSAAASPLVLSLADAALMAMENDPELAVERLNPQILETYVDEAQADFDPRLTSVLGKERVRGLNLSSSGTLFELETHDLVGELAMAQTFPTGTSLELGASTDVVDASGDGQQLVESRLGVSVAQPLLRKAGMAANMARVRAARLDVLASQYEVRGFAETLIADVEHTYWDYALAKRETEIYAKSIDLAQKLLEDVRVRVENGLLARSQAVAPEAELALRRQDMVDARGDMEKARVLLLGYLNLYRSGGGGRDVQLADELVMPDTRPGDVESHVGGGLCMRPELNQTRLLARRGRLEVLKTRNGLLPRLDLFVTFGRTGYADTFSNSWDEVGSGTYDLLVGVSLERHLGNHAARAEHTRAAVGQNQTDQALLNLERLVQVDVRTAHAEAVRALEKVAAVTATRALDEQKLAIETERLNLGQASSFQAARAQRDLVERQIDEAEAIADYRKALVKLYRLDGSLLKRRGISAPGEEPAEPRGNCG